MIGVIILQVDKNDLDNMAEAFKKVEHEISRHMIGQKSLIRQMIIAIIAGGNVLLEGVPGLGKTRLVKTIGQVLDLDFSRIQFTPDLMPADVVGTNIISRASEKEGMFKFQPGPVFSNIVLADEINRATPKTQSALLEAMQEHTVTVGSSTYNLPEPYFVLATQNPIEMEGTYPLPEAQMDRFMLKLNVIFPTIKEMKEIVNLTTKNKEEALEKIANGSQIIEMRRISREVPIADPVLEYAIKLIMATHPDNEFSTETVKKYVRYGSSPRGAQALINGSRVMAVLEGRYNVAYDDINAMAYPALRHRIFINFEGTSKGLTSDDAIEAIIKELT